MGVVILTKSPPRGSLECQNPHLAHEMLRHAHSTLRFTGCFDIDGLRTKAAVSLRERIKRHLSTLKPLRKVDLGWRDHLPQDQFWRGRLSLHLFDDFGDSRQLHTPLHVHGGRGKRRHGGRLGRPTTELVVALVKRRHVGKQQLGRGSLGPCGLVGIHAPERPSIEVHVFPGCR